MQGIASCVYCCAWDYKAPLHIFRSYARHFPSTFHPVYSNIRCSGYGSGCHALTHHILPSHAPADLLWGKFNFTVDAAQQPWYYLSFSHHQAQVCWPKVRDFIPLRWRSDVLLWKLCTLSKRTRNWAIRVLRCKARSRVSQWRLEWFWVGALVIMLMRNVFTLSRRKNRSWVVRVLSFWARSKADQLVDWLWLWVEVVSCWWGGSDLGGKLWRIRSPRSLTCWRMAPMRYCFHCLRRKGWVKEWLRYFWGHFRLAVWVCLFWRF